MSETTIEAVSGSTDVDETGETDELRAADAVEEELLVEEVSIDGMCGVY